MSPSRACSKAWRRWCRAPAASGRAVTVREVTGRRGDFASEDFKVGQMIEAAGPGDILVIDNGGHCVSTFGGLATLAAKLKGVAGLVVDGGVRDREEMIEHAFPVFARHMTPLTGRTRLAVTAINEPVSCGGVRVQGRRRHRRRRLGRGVHPGRACREGRRARPALRPRRRGRRRGARQGPHLPRGDGQVPAHLSRGPEPGGASAGDEAEDQTERSFLLSLLVLTFAMNLVARGVPETFAVFLLPVQKGLGVSRSDITLTYSVYMLAYGLSGPLAGQLIDRLGARIAYGFGLASLGLGYLLAGFATELWHYLVTVGLLGGLGAASLGMIVASSLLTRWFSTRIGSVMSLPYAAIGARHADPAAADPGAAQHYDWRVTHMVLGAGVLLTLPLVMLLPLGRMTAGSPQWRSLRTAAAGSAAGPWRVSAAHAHQRLLGPVRRLSLRRRSRPTASCRTRSPI